MARKTAEKKPPAKKQPAAVSVPETPAPEMAAATATIEELCLRQRMS